MEKLRIHYFQQTPNEGIGCIENWALSMGHRLTSTMVYENTQFPDINEIDWLIIMGGPMGAYEEDKYPWLAEEKKYIKKAIGNNKVVLGICLGSQLIANVLGAKVYPNKYKEIGFFKIYNTREAEYDEVYKLLPGELDVFHWHGDTFDLPEGAKHLSYSEATKNQAFIYNNKVLAMQFHFEVTKTNVLEFIEDGREELVKDKYVQTESEIRQNIYNTIELNVFMKCILERLQNITK